jgi:hypothetical protein
MDKHGNSVDRELRRIFGLPGARKLEGWLDKSAAWVMERGYPQVTVGEDEAGPWWEISVTGGGVQWCLAKTQLRGEMGVLKGCVTSGRGGGRSTTGLGRASGM